MCRKFHGSAFATFAVAAPADFRWVQGEDKVRTYPSSEQGGRTFCPRCGSATPALPEGGPFALIPMGNVAEDPEARPRLHFFVGSKAPWHEIYDNLPRHETFPPEFGAGAGIEQPVRAPETDGATSGSCLCGAVRYEYDGEPDRMVNCFCSRCRRGISAAYGTFLMVPHAAFRWLAGEDHVVEYKVPEARVKGTAFCRTCGSEVPRRRDDQHMQIAAGGLDTDPGVRPSANIFVASRAAWIEPDPSLPAFDEYPPAA